MFAFIINRILQAIPVMLAVALISFAMFAYVCLLYTSPSPRD